jgi:hypothetical protein
VKLIKKDINSYINIELPIFANEAYLKSKSNDYGWFLNEKFIIAFTIENKLIFKRLIFTNETIYLDKKLNIKDEKLFLNELTIYCKLNSICDFIYKAQANAVFNTYPDGADYIEWGTYESKLNRTVEDNFSKFRSKDRNIIRKAIKSDVTVKITNNIEEIYKNIKSTFIRQNSLFFPSLNYLKTLEKNLGDKIIFFVVEHQEVIQGSAIIVYDEKRAFYFYGGSITKPINGSINLLQYKILEHLYTKNVQYYDLMGARVCIEKGSKFEAIQKFKSRFGTNLKKGYAFRVIINPLKFRLFTLMVTAYFKLKGSQYLDPIETIRRCNEQHITNL